MIGFVNLKREYEFLKEDIDAAIGRVLNRGHFLFGPEVESFEKEFSDYNNVPHAVSVNSGTDALFLSLKCIDVGHDDEIIVPANSAIPTAMAVVMSGAIPVFADCGKDYLIDVDQLEGLINKKTKAIIPVHLYGGVCDMDRVMDIANKYNLKVIEDCAQATGATYGTKKVGTIGDFGCFSFYPTKNLGAYGDGGMILCKNADDEKVLRSMRFYGQDNKVYVSNRFGINSRLNEIQASILRVKLKFLDEWNEKRRVIAQRYLKEIVNKNVCMSSVKENNDHVYHLFVSRIKNRDKYIQILKDNGVQALIHYPVPIHKQDFFCKWQKELLVRSEKFSKEVFSLPLHPFLEKDEIEKIISVINKN